MKLFNNSIKGMTLVEVLIATGIMSILMFAVSSMIIQISKEEQYFETRLEILGTEFSIFKVFSDASTCTKNLKNSIFDSTSLATTSVSYNEIFASDSLTAPAIVKTPASTAINGLLVNSIKLENIQSLGISDGWTGEVVVKFNNSLLLRPAPDYRLKTIFSTDSSSPDNAKVITNCSFTNSSGSCTPGTPYLESSGTIHGYQCWNPITAQDMSALFDPKSNTYWYKMNGMAAYAKWTNSTTAWSNYSYGACIRNEGERIRITNIQPITGATNQTVCAVEPSIGCPIAGSCCTSTTVKGILITYDMWDEYYGVRFTGLTGTINFTSTGTCP